MIKYDLSNSRTLLVLTEYKEIEEVFNSIENMFDVCEKEGLFVSLIFMTITNSNISQWNKSVDTNKLYSKFINPPAAAGRISKSIRINKSIDIDPLILKEELIMNSIMDAKDLLGYIVPQFYPNTNIPLGGNSILTNPIKSIVH